MKTRRLAFLGPEGTFSEQAAVAYAPAAELIAAPSIAAVTQAVIEGTADEAIVPIENSLVGAVNETLDLLIHQLTLKIRAEVVLPIVHCVIGAAGTRFEDVRVVYSKPEALGQCARFLAEGLPQAETRPALSTAGAVGQALETDDAVAIAPEAAAALHGATVLRVGVQDDDRNKTRFVVLSQDDAEPTGDDKTSLVIATLDVPGALVKVLLPFAEAGIDLTKIESRPAKEELGTYVFLVDCAGHRADPVVVGVLRAVEDQTTLLKLLGSYPRYEG
ncbi:MAG TPA: prephenate dehydratase [Dehalococcoidia bacterium]|nr:prephenate dehydratase [Dehalococcoidia bacterium]